MRAGKLMFSFQFARTCSYYSHTNIVTVCESRDEGWRGGGGWTIRVSG